MTEKNRGLPGLISSDEVQDLTDNLTLDFGSSGSSSDSTGY